MSVQFKEQGTAILAYRGGKHVATIMRQGDKFGFTVFNTPHMGSVSSEDEARSAVERHLP